MDDWRIPGVDEAALREHAQPYFETYKRAYIVRDYLNRAPDDLFPPSFTIVGPERGH
jgi:8-oxoguanine deaminase